MLHIRRARSHVWIALGAVMCALAMMAAPAPAAAARPLVRGFADDVWFTGGPTWVQRTIQTGARVVLLEIDWNHIEPSAPQAPDDPTSPSDPQYDFSYVDAVLRQFEGTGISPAFLVTDAPGWAEAPGGPQYLEALGGWKPNATAYGQMATALARRYSGSFPDPQHPGQMLPHIRYYQAWAEPNFSIHLAPQWVQSGGRLVPYAPSLYRSLLNAFYAGVKQATPATPSSRVALAPTATHPA